MKPTDIEISNNRSINMKLTKTLGILAAAACMSHGANAAVTSYSQNFDGLTSADDTVTGFELGIVGGEGFVVFASVFFGTSQLYSYGTFTAPNGGAGFSAIAGGEGANGAGDQYMNVYSDYGNADHNSSVDAGVIFDINTSVFKEQAIEASDIGSSWTFSGTYKAPSSGGIAEPGTNATANAFIATIDPNNGFARTNYVTFDTTGAPFDGWTDFSMDIDLSDAALAGQLIQFGFSTTADSYDPSGVYYDNLSFSSEVPVPAAAWLFGSALLGLVGIGRKRS
jgi:hypothetical protein